VGFLARTRPTRLISHPLWILSSPAVLAVLMWWPRLSVRVQASIDICRRWHVLLGVAQTLKSADVFTAVAGAHRREILDTLVGGEKAVGVIVNELSMSQPQVSKHLRVLSNAGLVQCRSEGRRRLYRFDPRHLQPLREWMAKYEQIMSERLNQMDDYLKQLPGQGEQE
jgi:DNA-binding transcriptional ArsR family regulator